MSERAPVGLYVYQPFGSVTHPERDKTGRLYAVGGLPIQARCDGLTKSEAHAVVEALQALNQRELEPWGAINAAGQPTTGAGEP